MRASAFTAEVLVGGILFACLFDYMLERFVGNSWTFSYTLLGIEAGHPIFGFAIVYTVTVLSGHLTLPWIGPPPSALREWCGVVAALAPIAAALLFLALHPQGPTAAADILVRLFGHGRGEWWYFAGECVVAVLGLLVGKELVAQHLY